jgi:hypothetical protein
VHQLINFEWMMEHVQINCDENDDHNHVNSMNFGVLNIYIHLKHVLIVHLVVVNLQYVQQHVHHLHLYVIVHYKLRIVVDQHEIHLLR